MPDSQARSPADLDPEQLLDLALRHGAEAVEVFQSCSIARPVSFEANRLKQIEVFQSEGTALRLWRGGRPGLVVAEGAVEPRALVERAIALTALTEPEEIELAAATAQRYPDLGQAIAIERLVDWGWEAIELVEQVYPETICSGGWECEAEMTRLINSNGLDCSYTDTTLSADFSAEWVRGEDFLAVLESQTQRGSLCPKDLAQKVLQRLVWAQENVPPPQGRVPVLFTAKATELLWGTLQSALNGKQVVEKASPWSDRLGMAVTDTAITLAQDPRLGPYSCPFDDEGVPTRPITFLRDGVLQLFYTDRVTGKLLSSGSTGNGFRPGLGSYPAPGLFNLLVKPGDRSLPDLISGLSDGLIVDQVLGSGAGVSGEFAVNVDLGYRVRQGQVVGRIKDTMIAGNVYAALKALVALGSDADWYGACYTPSLIVESVSTIGR